jgi:hypothetical protein
MNRHDHYTFVLWGDEFEEAAAAIFVAELRQVGLRVKLVGLTSRRICGAHGLVLVPDLTLDQALPLATQVICLIIPQTAPGLQRLKNDPRLNRFFDLVCKNRVRLIMGPLAGVDIGRLEIFPPAMVDNLIVYPEREGLIAFTRWLAYLLLED